MHVHLRKAIFALLVTPIALWAADRQAGTWKLNLEKSKYTADHPAPKSVTVNIQEQEGGLKVLSFPFPLRAGRPRSQGDTSDVVYRFGWYI